MSVVHPGKVQTNNPSVTLSNYSDADRTRFLYNGTQFIKAKLVVPRASYAYVGYIYADGYSQTTEYTAYKDVSGNYVLVNGEKYIPEATGAPLSTQAHYIIVGFPAQVSTNEIYFWTTSALYESGSLIKVQYSYDNETYFDISGESVTWEFDDTIEQRAGESPPAGEYRYKIALGAYYTARYFKITTYTTTTLSGDISNASKATLTVTSTSDFISASSEYNQYLYAWFNFSGGGKEGWRVPITYTGKTGSSFTGVTYDWTNATLYGTYVAGPGVLTADNWTSMSASAPEARFNNSNVYTSENFAQVVTEVEVVRNTGPVLEVWDTDGSQAATQDLEFDYYYDIVYDSASDSYFTIRQNTSFNGTAGSSFNKDDDFSGTSLDGSRWDESETDTGFQLNVTSGTLECRSANNRGQLTTDYYMDGDFDSDVALGFNTFAGDDSRVELRAIDNSDNNVFAQIGYRGPYTSPGALGDWEALNIRKTIDTTAGAAYISGLRVNTTHVPVGSESFQFTYVSASGTWTVVSGSGGALGDVTPGVSYSEGPFDTMSILHTDTPADGSTIELTANHPTSSGTVDNPWGWRLGISKNSDNLTCKYDDSTGFTNWIVYTGSSGRNLKLELFADNSGVDSSLTLDNFVASGTGRWPGIPMLSIEAVNESGNRTTVAGLTDGEGYLIKEFDIINIDSNYFDWGNGKVQLATDGLTNGNIYVKVGADLYKYAKSSLPLASEDGSSATISKEDVIESISEVNFGYNAYTKAGLFYIDYDAGRDGVYVKTLGTSTVSGTSYESLLDVSVDTYPLAYDINNYGILYYVDGTSLKFYNMDENDVSFCNVSSDDKLLSAGSGETASVDATVLNVYGEALEGKTVTFSVSAGDGAVSPSSDCTTASGIATTTYTVGSTVGDSTISATASDIAC